MKTLLFTSLLLVGGGVDASKASERALRHDFMRQMDAAMAHQKKEEDFMTRLLKIAQPMKQQQQQQPELMQPSAHNLEEYNGYAVNLTDYALKFEHSHLQ
jgi:hypothetical protein